MLRPPFNDVLVFAAVARLSSFGRAAAFLDVSPSSVSHAVRGLEERLGVRLLARTTRKVDLTEPGRRLVASLAPALAEIEEGLTALAEWREDPAGTIRLTTFRYFADTILAPILPGFFDAYPHLVLDVVVDNRFSDLVTNGFDAGIRFGADVPKDMAAVRLGADVEVMVVASPDYLAQHRAPIVPHDLLAHRCMGYRLEGGETFAWSFSKGDETVQVRPKGPLRLNLGTLARAAVREGAGIGYFLAEDVRADVLAGRLVRVLSDWHRPMPGPHLYHLGRRQTPPALRALIDHLRSRITPPPLSASRR